MRYRQPAGDWDVHSISELPLFRGCRTFIVESAEVIGAAPVVPGQEGAVSFSTSQGDDLREVLHVTQSSLVLVSEIAEVRCTSTIVVPDPRTTFMKLLSILFPSDHIAGVAATAFVHTESVLADDVYIGPNAVLGKVSVGRGTRIEAGAVIADETVIGEHCTIGPNSCIGQSGFGYGREPDGTPVHFPHLGRVVIGDRVEIGACTTIDRATLSKTVIEDDVKIDNLVHIAHNCHIGRGSFIIATAIISGSVRIGPRAWIAPNASIREHLEIGADAVVGLAANVISDVEQGSTVVGNPARNI